MLNWAQTLMQGAGAAGVAFIGADYLAPSCCRPPMAYLACLAGARLRDDAGAAGIELSRCKSGAHTQNLLSVLKIGMIIGLAGLALLLGAASCRCAAPPAAFGAGMPAACCGAGPMLLRLWRLPHDDESRRRSQGRAAPLSAGDHRGHAHCVGLYLLLNFAYQHVLGTAGIAQLQLVAAALSRATFGPCGRTVISVAVFLSAAGFVNATILQMPRSFSAMAADGVLPRAFLRVNPAHTGEEVGLLFFGATMLLPAFVLGSFEKLLNYVIFTDTLSSQSWHRRCSYCAGAMPATVVSRSRVIHGCLSFTSHVF